MKTRTKKGKPNLTRPGVVPPTPPKATRRAFLRNLAPGGLALILLSRVAPAFKTTQAKAAPPPDEDLAFQSATALAKAIRTKAISSEETVRACLKRIAAVNPALNAVCLLNEQPALSQARAADQALARGQPIGPLHGVPMTIKDSLDTAGLITTAGTMGRAHFVPPQDATVVARLRAAGAILLGKTNTPEITMAGDTFNLIYGRTQNPYDLTRTPGGSSGGATAIIAAGGSPFDIGSDTQGSIRIPSHFCGVAGLKPTSGRVPLTGHIIPTGGPIGALTQLGPIARFVEDLALILPIISGPDGNDPAVVPVPLADPSQVNIKTLRAAFFTGNGLSQTNPDVADTVRAAAKALAEEGVRIEERQPEGFAAAKEINSILMKGGGASYYRNILTACGTTQMHPNTADLLERIQAGAVSGRAYTAGLLKQSALRQEMMKFMSDYDLLICPPASGPAPLPSELHTIDFSYAWFFNVLGWPAAVVRAGKTKDGLPIGVQVAAPPWQEHQILALAARIENRLGGWKRAP